MKSKSKRILGQVRLYAPNVHTGGGAVLLQSLLDSWPDRSSLQVYLDQRARAHLKIPSGAKAIWVRPRVTSRFTAELRLFGACQRGDTVFCFHGLPPLLPNPGRVVVLLQNRILLGVHSLAGFSLWTTLRLAFERKVGWLFRRRVAEYVVQTSGMARDLVAWYGEHQPLPKITVFPFVSEVSQRVTAGIEGIQWDFIYVAYGEVHKNHLRLLEAWKLLAQQGIRPRLGLTLRRDDVALLHAVERLREQCGAEIYNLGELSHERIFALYRQSRALIFPSLVESFGLPLVEARQTGLPILAPELDYVRDVCDPVQTFDPKSAVSIARSVRRFLRQPEEIRPPRSPAECWDHLLEDRELR